MKTLWQLPVIFRTGLLALGVLAPVTPANAVEPSTPTQTLNLPALFSDESHGPAPRWRYAQLPGMEFLSCCSDDWTTEFIDRTWRLNQRLDEFLPAQLRLNLAVPTTFVLYGVAQKPVDLQEIVTEMQRRPHGQEGVDYATFADLTVQQLPNFRFREQDEQAMMFLTKLNLGGTGRMFLSLSYVRFLMENRTPPLPRWFVDGMIALYQISSLETAPIYTLSSDGDLPGWQASEAHETATTPKPAYFSVLVRVPVWMFGSNVRHRLAADPHWKPPFLPMAELLSTPPPPNGDGVPGTNTSGRAGAGERNERYILWWSQSALFIHWAFHRGESQSREAFWKFVERASVEPVTEAMVKEYFGMGYSDMDKTLSEYFPAAVNDLVRMNLHGSPEPPSAALRNATDAEVGRIKGNLERLEIGYVKDKFPALAPKYLAQARHTLRQAYDQGARESGLLEVMGLCECDGGDDAAARPFLKAAAQAGAVRPRVYYELARIKFHELRSRDASAKLNAQQTAELLELLFSTRSKSPPLSGVYELIASVWLQSTVTPARENLAVLDEGIRFFPADLRLINFACVLYAASGFRDDALQLVRLGLRTAPGGPDRTRFLKLESVLTSHP